MSRLVVRHLRSVDELRRAAPAWNDLWRRSAVARPTSRAKMIALWCECFAPGRAAGALVVEAAGEPLAALPLIVGRRLGLRVAQLPGNPWSPAGELLIDADTDGERARRALADGLRRIRPGWMWLDAVPLNASHWQSLLRVLAEGRHPLAARRQFRVAIVEVRTDWNAYFASRSRNHRRQVHKVARRAHNSGTISLVRHEQLSPEEVEPVLRTCFELEAAGWKGRRRSAVLCVPGAWDFHLRQARQLAAWGELRIAILNFDARPIAFEYGWEAKGVRAVLKVGFAEAFGRLSPGQLLRYLLLEELFNEGYVRTIDYMGPITDATVAWATDEYHLGRVACSFSSLAGRAAIAALHYGGPLVRRIRPTARPTQSSPRPNRAEPEPAEVAVGACE